MVLPAADSFCNCVTFGILGTFQRVIVGHPLLSTVPEEERRN
ncbi:hypothetical protein T09_2502 [Trichinella sp. T9]|nr:hypothetical protein T09_2502 [Trichinella sp. T9]